MAFLRKKKVKFSVALVVEKLTDVPLLNAVIFAKVRLLECGSFVGTTLHRPVCSHQVDFMSPSVSRRFNSSAPSNIRMRSRTNSGQIYPNANVHRRHSLTERSPRELDDAPRKWDDSEEALKAQAENSQIDEASYQKILEQVEARNRKYEHLLKEDGIKNEFDELIQNRILASDQPEYFIDELGNLAHAEKNTQPFSFYCYIPYDSKYSGELEACRCKISLRKEDRAGRNPQKLGYVIINLSEFAGSGNTGIRKSFLLDGYFTSQRQDNSRVHIFIRMQHDSLDPLFKVPNSASLLFQQQNQNDIEDNNTNLLLQHDQLGQWLNPVDRRAPPPSPNEINNNNGVGGSSSGNVNNATTNSGGCTKEHLQHYQHPKEERSSSLITNLSSNTCTIPSTSTTISSISSIFPTVPGGLGHNMSMRVQRTRRDPGDVIDELQYSLDALTTNETLAAGRNAFLMSHLFERINLKNQQQKMLMNETERRNSLFFDDCPQWLPNLIENGQNQNLIEATTISQTNFENKILNENTAKIATTTEISNNFSLLNDENEATNPFIYPPTELAPNNNFDNKNNREDVQYPY
uniref:C2 NT-type domain-containing protein n=1 Tax=Meloidogyne javanica TaxID=6303 RepID=A0A915LTU4_MELJA